MSWVAVPLEGVPSSQVTGHIRLGEEIEGLLTMVLITSSSKHPRLHHSNYRNKGNL